MRRLLLSLLVIASLFWQSSFMPVCAETSPNANSAVQISTEQNPDQQPALKNSISDSTVSNPGNSNGGSSSTGMSTSKKIFLSLAFATLSTAIAVPIAGGVATHHHHHNGNQSLQAYYLLRIRQLQTMPPVVPMGHVPPPVAPMQSFTQMMSAPPPPPPVVIMKRT